MLMNVMRRNDDSERINAGAQKKFKQFFRKGEFKMNNSVKSQAFSITNFTFYWLFAVSGLVLSFAIPSSDHIVAAILISLLAFFGFLPFSKEFYHD